MADQAIVEFIGVTGCSPERAQQFLTITDNNLEQAVQLFFDSPDIGDAPTQLPSNNHTSSAPRTSSRTTHGSRYGSRGNIIDLDSDGDGELSDDDDLVEIGATARGHGSASRRPAEGRATRTNFSNTPPPRGGGGSGGDYNTDEAMERDAAIARSMQEALYADGAMPDEDGVRAPMARTTETLVGPGADYGQDSEEIEQMMAHIQARQQRSYGGRAGIFNQQSAASLWDEQNQTPTARRQNLARATGGASESSTKASMLAELFRPPFELMSHISWEVARQKGKDQEKWLLVNVQDPAVFDCQVLNRDIWKNTQIKETVKENFIFLQYNKDDPRASQYVQYYFAERNNQDAYPHIAIVDPRTGEQLKVWSGPPVPKAAEFLEQLYEFLGRYSLDANAKNPVARRKPEKKKTLDVARMTEDEMLEMALKNSMGGGNVTSLPEDDPDALTKSVGDINNDNKNNNSKSEGKKAETQQDEDPMDFDPPNGIGLLQTTSYAPSLFSRISATNPHVEPTPTQPNTTRIQFRHSGGRIIRRFALNDPVRRIFEWLKAEPLADKTGMDFELVCMGQNLVEQLDMTVEQAGLKNQTVMVEFTEN